MGESTPRRCISRRSRGRAATAACQLERRTSSGPRDLFERRHHVNGRSDQRPGPAFISHGRIAALSPERKKRTFEQIAPDAVFELLSPTDRLPYTVGKCEEYVETGSAIAVLLDPRDRSVTLYRRGFEPVVARDAGAITIGAEMPGFVLDAEAVFDASKRGDDDAPSPPLRRRGRKA